MRLLEKLIRTRWYVALVLATWIFAPEVRRIIDWRSTFHAVSILSVLPLIALLPGLILLRKDWAVLGSDFHRIFRLWMIGNGLAYLIALLSGGLLSATFGLVSFCLPIAFAPLYFAGQPGEPLEMGALYKRCADALLIATSISALYGIYQYAAPPPWDVYWAASEDIEAAQGATTAFGFRIFGTLNSAAPYANVLMMALLFNLPRISLRRWPIVLLAAPVAIALALTTVRSIWLGLAVGMIVYFFFAASRVRLAVSVAASLGVVLLAGAIIGATVKDSAIGFSSLSDRFASFSDLANDNSVRGRQEQTQAAVDAAVSTPTGVGLGKIGAAGRLSAGGWLILDNGYASRFLELGYIGFALFLICLGMGIVCAVGAYRVARSRNDRDATDILAMSVATQAMLIFIEAGNDEHLSFLGMFFWLTIAIPSAYSYAHRPVVDVRFGSRSRAAGNRNRTQGAS